MADEKSKADDEAAQEYEPRQVKRRRLLHHYATSDIITVLIGPEEKAFNIHKDLLCAQSPYCAARLSDAWKDDHAAGLKLPDFKVWPFSIIFNWLYTGNLSVNLQEFSTYDFSDIDEADEEDEDGDDTDNEPNWLGWLELYRTADVLLMTALQNQIVDHDLKHVQVKEGGRTTWGLLYARYWLEKTIAHTPYYQLFLDDVVEDFQNARNNQKPSFHRRLQKTVDYPQALADVLSKIWQWNFESSWTVSATQDRCKYHIHENGETCGSEVEAQR